MFLRFTWVIAPIGTLFFFLLITGHYMDYGTFYLPVLQVIGVWVTSTSGLYEVCIFLLNEIYIQFPLFMC